MLALDMPEVYDHGLVFAEVKAEFAASRRWNDMGKKWIAKWV